MILRSVLSFALIAALAACGGEPASTEATASNPAPPAPNASTAPAPSGDGAEGLQGIVLRYAPGGRPDAFCTPEWSVANQTQAEIPGLLIQIAWRGPDGQLFKEYGEFGTLLENLTVGKRLDRTLEGHVVACKDLTIVLGTYACRDANAVRTACPGPVHLVTSGGIQADVSALAEGAMRGAVEP